ncbi:hypothetical protein JYU06_03855, partial [Desulfotalea psychrophila]|nr:hypothetical protein [Desulfotalea psychrophila]
MAKLNMRYIVVIILILVTGIIVNTLQHAPSQDNEAGLQAVRSIPLQVGSWKGYDIPLKEDVYEILETRAIVHRNYIA